MLCQRAFYVVLTFVLVLGSGFAIQAAVVLNTWKTPTTEGWTLSGTPGFADATGKPNWRQQFLPHRRYPASRWVVSNRADVRVHRRLNGHGSDPSIGWAENNEANL